MFQSLEIFRTSGAMAFHAGTRQATFARNMANSDTPGYRAQYVPPFRDVYQTSPASALRTTRPVHLGSDPVARPPLFTSGGTEPAPNGNAVSIETEMLRGVEASREHNRALAIYRHGMSVIRSTLAR